MNTSINIPDLLTIIYVLVGDWYQAQGVRLLQGQPGAKPELSDSEMITLMLAQDFIPYPGEMQFVGLMRANYGELFPRLHKSRLRQLGHLRRLPFGLVSLNSDG